MPSVLLTNFDFISEARGLAVAGHTLGQETAETMPSMSFVNVPFPSKASACQGGPGFCEARGEVAGLDMD